jgi:hypothetical protein
MGYELRDDALSSDPDYFVLRLGLPWMRSLPLSCVLGLEVALDGTPIDRDDLRVRLGTRQVAIGELAAQGGTWWFLQDRLVLEGHRMLVTGSEHEVSVALRLLLPYLSSGPEEPAVLPFRMERRLRVGAPTEQGAFHDVGSGSTR